MERWGWVPGRRVGPFTYRALRREPASTGVSRSKVKVLYVSHTSLVSGAERALLDLLNALPEFVSPTVACPSGPLADALQAMGVEVADLSGISGGLRLHPLQTPRTVGELTIAARALRRTVRATGADVVHANSLRAGLVTGWG
jgi:L-malate glycosyltransferase